MHTLNYITYASMTVHISVRIRGSRRQTQFQWQTLKQWGTHSIEFVLENYHQIVLFVYFCFNTAPLCSSHSLFKPNGPHCWSALCPARSCINEYYHFCMTQLLFGHIVLGSMFGRLSALLCHHRWLNKTGPQWLSCLHLWIVFASATVKITTNAVPGSHHYDTVCELEHDCPILALVLEPSFQLPARYHLCIDVQWAIFSCFHNEKMKGLGLNIRGNSQAYLVYISSHC